MERIFSFLPNVLEPYAQHHAISTIGKTRRITSLKYHNISSMYSAYFSNGNKNYFIKHSLLADFLVFRPIPIHLKMAISLLLQSQFVWPDCLELLVALHLPLL